MIDLNDIIEQCRRNNRKAQKELYEVYAPVLYGICTRYAKTTHEAEDILQEGFIKILTKIRFFKGEGSFEGWMKKIMINTAISYLKIKNRTLLTQIPDSLAEEPEEEGLPQELPMVKSEILLTLIQDLPLGYRTVFNLYVFEQWSHKAISEELGISESTSKTQLFKARRMLKMRIESLLSEPKLLYQYENRK